VIAVESAISTIFAAIAAGSSAIMMIGLPASGKSTFVRHLRTRCDIAVLSMDAFRELACAEMGIAYADSMVEPRNAQWDVRNRALDAALRQMLDTIAQQAVATGRSLVWDRTNLTRVQRRDRFAQSPGYFRIGVYVPIAPEVSRAACAAREAITGRPILPGVLDRMIEAFEPPEEGEFDVLLTLDETIRPAAPL
jgi:predicted kinase